MIDPQTIEPDMLIHAMKKSEREKESVAKGKDDSGKGEKDKNHLKSDLERNYRGFNMPAVMDEDQEKDYKAAVDKRLEETKDVEDERAMERGKEALEGAAKSATELPGDIGEVAASVPPAASHLIGSALVAKRKAYEDPTEAIRQAREFGSKIFEGDPEAQEQALIGTSMSMMEPAATAADVELARRDVRKAIETRKAGDIATAGVSTIAAGIPVLGVGMTKLGSKAAKLKGTAVVDDAGEPLRVYHGTPRQFDEFDTARMEGRTPGSKPEQTEGQGTYFIGSKGAASTYAGKEGRVVEAFLDVKNPFIVGESSFSGEARKVIRDYLETHHSSEFYIDEKMSRFGGENLLQGTVPPSVITAAMKADGFDGVKSFGPQGTEYVVFDASQIRIAPKADKAADVAKPPAAKDEL